MDCLKRRIACVLGMGLLICSTGARVSHAEENADLTIGPDGKVAAPVTLGNVRYAFTPDDTYFHRDTPSGGWPGQWHLINEHTANRDAGVQGAWNRDLTGNGVVIGIVDDCLERNHEDLADNYTSAHSRDFGDDDSNPDPVHADDQHGISVAGVAAARGNNDQGVTGAAPYADLAGLRIDFNNQTTQMFVDATLYHSNGGNTAITIKNHSYGYSSPFISTPQEVAALNTSAEDGTIHVFAAGNERGASAQDSNKLDVQNDPDSISVAAMGSDGMYSSYSNFGATVFVTAPSSDSGGFGITTTDRSGDDGYNTGSGDTFPDTNYTSIFGGTSSAAPLVAGVMALVKEAQPDLDVRFAKHLLARTSRVVDASDSTTTSDGGWRTNGAGFQFNQNYGFGLIDADALTAMAVVYTGVTDQSTESTGNKNVGDAIPDNDPNGITETFDFSDTDPLEEVLVELDVTHTYRGDLEAYLTSPSGYTSRLMTMSIGDGGTDLNWTFCTNAFWGEDPSGTWSLTVSDNFADDTGTWNSYEVTARMGDVVPEPATMSLLAFGALGLLRRRKK